MNEPSVKSLETRLNLLERENRRLKRINNFVVVGIIAAIVMGQSQCNLNKTGGQSSKLVEAQQFILQDTSGKSRAKIGIGDLGPELSFLDVTGKKRISLVFSDPANQGILGFSDKDGARRILLKENLLWLLDQKQDVRGNFSLEDDGSPTLSIVGATKGPGVDDPKITLAERNGRLSLQFADQKSKVRAELNLEPSGSPSLTLLDDKQQPRASLGTTSLVNTNTEAKTQTAESSLTLLNKDGKVIWRAP